MRRNLVGRSEVSAITQTPASAPVALVTTPPMSSLSTATRTGCCARSAMDPVKSTAARTTTVMAKTRIFIGYLGGSVRHGVGFHFDWSASFLNDVLVMNG